MRKILYRAEDIQDPTSFYRIGGVLPYIDHENLLLKDISHQHISWAVFSGFETLIIQRPATEAHLRAIRLAKDMGIKVIADYDDDLLNVGIHNPTYSMYQHLKENCCKCIGLADEIWVSTNSIGQSYSDYNKNIQLIPNAHNDYIFPVRYKMAFNAKKKLAMWRGGASHEADLYAHTNEIISMINGNGNWEFRFLGGRFSAIEMHTGDNHKIVEPMTLFPYFNYLFNANPQLMFFPLEDTPLNRGKSCISWLECTYAGGAFMGETSLPEFCDKPIFQFSKDQFDALKSDQKTLKEANEASWEFIKGNLLLSNINDLRIKRLLCE